jgi:ABC-type transporter Mla subunit MlaD
MTSAANRWKLGLFVVAAAAVVVMGMTWLGYARLQKRSHAFNAFFDEAVTGLTDGAPVRFRGVPIGNVTEIKVAPDKKHIHVVAALFDDRLENLGLDPRRLEVGNALPPGLRAQIVVSAFTSIAFVQVDYFAADAEGLPPYPFPVPPNTIKTVPSTFKSIEEGARDLVRLLPALVEDTRALLAQVQRELREADVPELARALRAGVGELRATLERAESAGVLAETSGAMQEVRQLAAHWRSESGPVHGLLRELDRLAHNASAALDEAKLGETTAGLRAAGGGVTGTAAELSVLARDVRAELQTLRQALVAIERLADSLERDPAALLRGKPAGSSPLERRE